MIYKRTLKFVDNFFLRYFFIIYYLYMMSVGVILPKDTVFGKLINIILFLFLVFASITRKKQSSKFIIIYAYIFFICILALMQSSNYMYSYTNIMKYSISLMALPVGFATISSTLKLKDFFKNGIVCLVLYIINIIIANVFNLGSISGYGAEDELQIGNVFMDGLYACAYAIVSFFILLYLFPNKRKLISVLVALCSLLIVINMKRTVIFVLFVGFIQYVLMYYYIRNKALIKTKSYKKYIIALIMLLVAITPFGYKYIEANMTARERIFEDVGEGMSQEGRVREFGFISDEIFKTSDVSKFLFGKETFNLVGTYANGYFGNRGIHGDYSIMIHSTGVIGIMFWLSIYIYIIIWFIKLQRNSRLKYSQLSIMLYSLFFTYICVYLITMMSGVWVKGLLSSSYYFACLGGILRYFYNRSIYFNYIKS